MQGDKEGGKGSKAQITGCLLTLLVLAAVCGASALAGCGSENSAAAPLTKKQFIARGEEICRAAKRERLELRAGVLKKYPHAEEGHLVIPAVVPAVEKEIRKLKALGPPGGDEAKIKAILRGLELAVKDAKYDPYDVLVEQTDPFRAPNKLARAYGFGACGNAP